MLGVHLLRTSSVHAIWPLWLLYSCRLSCAPFITIIIINDDDEWICHVRRISILQNRYKYVFIWSTFSFKMYLKSSFAKFLLFCSCLKELNLPVSQSVPSYPSAHAQLYPFTVSVQVPEFWQGSLAHSSVSAQMHWNKARVYTGDQLMVNQMEIGSKRSVFTKFEVSQLKGWLRNVHKCFTNPTTVNGGDSKEHA